MNITTYSKQQAFSCFTYPNLEDLVSNIRPAAA